MRIAKLTVNIIFSIIGWVSSVVSLIKMDDLKPGPRLVISIAVGLFAILYALIHIFSFRKTKNASIHNSKEAVNKYLLNWLSKGTRTVIFTRDLTWADESDDIRVTLERKARNKELSICLYQHTETTKRLASLGAEIYVHNLPEGQIKSRFTIIDYGKNNPKITVGTRNNDGKFVNERYDMRTNPNACNAFIELFELVKSREVSGSAVKSD
ncbi:MAG: hypothetical protein J1E00_05990 [Oscillospiraceae bacterium]|nr:hypothetical protein [Oscillospiraceae bacterium]